VEAPAGYDCFLVLIVSERVCWEGEEPLLLFANRHDVRLMSLYTHDFKEVVNQLHSAIAVDYDYRGRRLFWTDVGSEKIFWLVEFI